MEQLRQQLGAIEREHAQSANYQKSLALLRALKSGEVAIDQVAMTDNGWALVDVKLDLSPVPPDDLAAELQKRNGSLDGLKSEAKKDG